jgi:hypothetical protein
VKVQKGIEKMKVFLFSIWPWAEIYFYSQANPSFPIMWPSRPHHARPICPEACSPDHSVKPMSSQSRAQEPNSIPNRFYLQPSWIRPESSLATRRSKPPINGGPPHEFGPQTEPPSPLPPATVEPLHRRPSRLFIA